MLYYSAVPLAVKTVFKKIHFGKCANYYKPFLLLSCILKKTLLLKPADSGELQADLYLVGMLLNRWGPWFAHDSGMQ